MKDELIGTLLQSFHKIFLFVICIHRCVTEIYIRALGGENVAKHIDNLYFLFFPRRHIDSIKSRQSQRNSKVKQRIANIFPVRRTISLNNIIAPHI